MRKVPVFVHVLHEAFIPLYATPLASGADLRAAVSESLFLSPGGGVGRVPTGLRLELPDGYEAQIRPRSGLAWNHQVTVLNAPGTIDADFRGELQVLLINYGREVFAVTPHMRIAQLVVAPCVQAEFTMKEGPLTASLRGEGGFGHTGAT